MDRAGPQLALGATVAPDPSCLGEPPSGEAGTEPWSGERGAGAPHSWSLGRSEAHLSARVGEGEEEGVQTRVPTEEWLDGGGGTAERQGRLVLTEGRCVKATWPHTWNAAPAPEGSQDSPSGAGRPLGGRWGAGVQPWAQPSLGLPSSPEGPSRQKWPRPDPGSRCPPPLRGDGALCWGVQNCRGGPRGEADTPALGRAAWETASGVAASELADLTRAAATRILPTSLALRGAWSWVCAEPCASPLP